MKKKIVIGGYYGYGSLGDEAVLRVLISEIQQRYPEYDISVLSASPAQIKKKYKVGSIYRYNIISVIRQLAGADLYISGGGSLMQDSTSLRSLRYYAGIIHLAKAMGVKVYAFANGVGPLKSCQTAISALSKCDHISVRDTASLKLLEENDISGTLSTDPFVLCEPADKYTVRRFLCERGIYTDKYFTVSLRRCKGRRQINEDSLLHALLPLVIKGYKPIFVSMQDKCDLALCAAMADMTGGYVISPTDAGILMGLQRDADFAIGMRLHFLLAAVLVGTPILALSYDPKVNEVLKYVADINSLDAFDFDSQLLSGQLPLSSGYKVNISALKALADDDLNMIGTLLESESELVNA